MPAVHLLIKGKVQGVFYRATASEVATGIGLTGWVRNTPEGHVEAHIQGSTSQIQSFLEWARKGPPRAIVTEVETEEAEEGEWRGFSVRR